MWKLNVLDFNGSFLKPKKSPVISLFVSHFYCGSNVKNFYLDTVVALYSSIFLTFLSTVLFKSKVIPTKVVSMLAVKD